MGTTKPRQKRSFVCCVWIKVGTASRSWARISSLVSRIDRSVKAALVPHSASECGSSKPWRVVVRLPTSTSGLLVVHPALSHSLRHCTLVVTHWFYTYRLQGDMRCSVCWWVSRSSHCTEFALSDQRISRSNLHQLHARSVHWIALNAAGGISAASWTGRDTHTSHLIGNTAPSSAISMTASGCCPSLLL